MSASMNPSRWLPYMGAALLAAAPAIHARNFDVITPLVATSVGLKAACVGRDPWETGEAGKGRVLLNLGHTLGHAIEAASGYEVAHGEAVALGLRAAARISELKGLAEPGLEALVVDALTRLRLPTGLDEWLVGERGAAVGWLGAQVADHLGVPDRRRRRAGEIGRASCRERVSSPV